MRENHNKDIGKLTFSFESLFFILLLCSPISLLAQQPTKSMDVNDLLELSLASFESLPPYAMHIETETSLGIPQESIIGEVYIFEKRYDNRRVDALCHRYEVSDDKEKKLVYDTRYVWTGEQFQCRQQYLGSDIAEEQQILAWGSYRAKDAKRVLTSQYSGSFISGVMLGDYQHVCKILKQSGNSKLYGKMETIGNDACYVVEGKTRHGIYKVWIDPNNGYNMRKAIVNKQIGDLYYDQPIAAEPSDKKVAIGYEISTSDVKVQKIGGHYIPISANLIHKYKYNDGSTEQETWSSKRSKIQLNPNFEEMGAFVMDGIPEGTRIRMNDRPGLVYIWADGRFLSKADIDAINSEPNIVGNRQANDLESQPEVLSETSFSPVMLLIPIGLLIIAVIGWQVFGFLKR
jgi:hypothetical protein